MKSYAPTKNYINGKWAIISWGFVPKWYLNIIISVHNFISIMLAFILCEMNEIEKRVAENVPTSICQWKRLPHEIDIRILFWRIRYDFEMHAS